MLKSMGLMIVLCLIGGCAGGQQFNNPILRESIAEISDIPCEFIGIGQATDGQAMAYFQLYCGKYWQTRYDDQKNWAEMAVPVGKLTIAVSDRNKNTITLSGSRTLFYNVPDLVWRSATLTVPNQDAKEKWEYKIK